MVRIVTCLTFSLAFSLLTGCNDSSFSKNGEPSAAGEPLRDSRQAAPPGATYGSEAPPPPESAPATEAAELETEDPSPIAAPPVMVGGAFLVCHQMPTVHCRLDDANKQNLEVPTHYMLQFSSNGVNLTFEPSTEPNWRWKVAITLTPGILTPLQLTLTSSRSSEIRYETMLEPRPVQVGDGTRQLQGCTTATMAAAVLAGPVWTRNFSLTSAAELALSIKGLCGIVRANDSILQIIDAENRSVFTQFLPTTAAPFDLRYMTARLAPGNYRLVVQAGDDIDIDDLIIQSMNISPIVP